MKKKEFFLILCFLFFGFAVWFFPKSIDPVKFLGFSDPYLLNKGELKTGKQNSISKKRKPSSKENISITNK